MKINPPQLFRMLFIGILQAAFLFITTICAEEIENVNSSSVPFRALLDRDIPTQHSEPPEGQPALPQVRALIEVEKAWKEFLVRGKGMSVAVLDTGLLNGHPDFGRRVKPGQNFTASAESSSDTDDFNGHGTHVAGIITANGSYNRGIAPDAAVVPIKVIGDQNSDFDWVEKALRWIVDYNHKNSSAPITVANLSLGTPENYSYLPEKDYQKKIRQIIIELRKNNVAVVVAAGNDYGTIDNSLCNKNEGMAFPAIIPETISIGSVYDEDNKGLKRDSCEGITFVIKKKNITSYSRRLGPRKAKQLDLVSGTK